MIIDYRDDYSSNEGKKKIDDDIKKCLSPILSSMQENLNITQEIETTFNYLMSSYGQIFTKYLYDRLMPKSSYSRRRRYSVSPRPLSLSPYVLSNLIKLFAKQKNLSLIEKQQIMHIGFFNNDPEVQHSTLYVVECWRDRELISYLRVFGYSYSQEKYIFKNQETIDHYNEIIYKMRINRM